MFAESKRRIDPPTGPLRLLVVDAAQLMAEALAALFAQHDFNVAGVATSAAEALILLSSLRPHVLLIDVHLPAGTGFALARDAAKRSSDIRIVFLDSDVHAERLREALKVNPTGYLTRRHSADRVAHWIARAAHTDAVFSDDIAELVTYTSAGWQLKMGRSSALAKLTIRERELLPHLARGLSVREVAELLERSPSTIDNHKARLMKKLGLHRIAELTRLAIREGIIEH